MAVDARAMLLAVSPCCLFSQLVACLEKILADGDAEGAAERVEAFDVGQLFSTINGNHSSRSALAAHDAALDVPASQSSRLDKIATLHMCKRRNDCC